MDHMTEEMVRKCRGCTLVAAPSKPNPMKRREMPKSAWKDVAIDYLCPLPSGHFLLVIVDYYSRFQETHVVSNTTSKITIKQLMESFARFGIPKSIT